MVEISTYEGDDTNPSSVIDDFMRNYNTPEAKAAREKAMQDADEIIRQSISSESEIKNDIIFSCLGTNEFLYESYARTIKEHPECKKYLQIYNYKGKDFLIVPVYDTSNNSLEINTVEIGKDGENLKIISKPYWIPDHPYTRESNVITVPLEDKTQQYGYHRISMNKWTGEISDIEPSEYTMDEKGINGLMDVIGERAGKKFEDCSEGMQSNVRDIISNDGELKQQMKGFEAQEKELIQNVIQGNFSGAVSCFIGILSVFFTKKRLGKVTNIGKGLDYLGDEADFEYLESAIGTVLDPEKRSRLTYLISKIKDKQAKEKLKEQGIENPSQFNLLLQQLQPGQIILTNGLKESEGNGTIFDNAIQSVSGSRWCHSLIIEDVVKDSKGTIIDAKIIQSTFKKGVHETSLKEYVNGRFSKADFLVANLPEEKRDGIIQHAKSRIGEKYDTVSVVTDSIFGIDVDKGYRSENGNLLGSIGSNLLGNNKAYCSELIFDAMEKNGLSMPEPHMSPSDILMSDQVSPQYACYCDKF